MPGFTLHPQLVADTVDLGSLALCRVLLAADSTYPWVILVPIRADIREIHDLDQADQQTLMAEITHISKAMQQVFAADKMNVAALGNMVPQLHVHVIARFAADPAWPGPIWGKVPAVPYAPKALDETRQKLKDALF